MMRLTALWRRSIREVSSFPRLRCLVASFLSPLQTESGLSSEKLSEFGTLLSKNKFPNLTVLDLSCGNGASR